nr:cytochrome c oxidase subunit 2 [Trichophilopterus babakotophilus]
MSWGQFYFQDGWSMINHLLIKLSDTLMVIMTTIIMMILYMILYIFLNKNLNYYFFHSEKMEFIWTVIPLFVLFCLVYPSFFVLYTMDDCMKPDLSIKVIGHQWYWSYEYGDFNVSFDSYMKSDQDEMSNFRLLDVDNNVIVPYQGEIRMVLTSSDVIHSWTIPSMGLKMDAVPGRLNQIYFSPNRIGLTYGQCSEICGAMHSFMPICLEVVLKKNFFLWLNKNIGSEQ